MVGPTFGEYARACRIAGAEVEEYRASEDGGFRWVAEDIAQAITRVRPKLAFLCNPNNPTGQLCCRPAIEQLLAACDETLLVVDEAYLPFCDTPVDLLPLLSSGRLLLLRSMTKDHGLAGLRLGYAVAPPEVVEDPNRVRPPWSVNAAAQAAGLAALGDVGHLEAARRVVRESRAYLVGELSELGLEVVPPTANFLLVRVGDGAAFRSALLERGVCVRDCASFGLPAYVRIGVRTLPDCRTAGGGGGGGGGPWLATIWSATARPSPPTHGAALTALGRAAGRGAWAAGWRGSPSTPPGAATWRGPRRRPEDPGRGRTIWPGRSRRRCGSWTSRPRRRSTRARRATGSWETQALSADGGGAAGVVAG